MGKWSFLIDDISPSSLEINRSESCVILFFNVKISIDWWSLYTERELDKNPSGHITCVEALSANHISCSKAQHSTNIHLHKSSLVFCPSILHIWDCCDKLLFWTSLWVFYLAVQLTEIRKHPCLNETDMQRRKIDLHLVLQDMEHACKHVWVHGVWPNPL